MLPKYIFGDMGSTMSAFLFDFVFWYMPCEADTCSSLQRFKEFILKNSLSVFSSRSHSLMPRNDVKPATLQSLNWLLDQPLSVVETS